MSARGRDDRPLTEILGSSLYSYMLDLGKIREDGTTVAEITVTDETGTETSPMTARQCPECRDDISHSPDCHWDKDVRIAELETMLAEIVFSPHEIDGISNEQIMRVLGASEMLDVLRLCDRGDEMKRQGFVAW